MMMMERSEVNSTIIYFITMMVEISLSQSQQSRDALLLLATQFSLQMWPNGNI